MIFQNSPKYHKPPRRVIFGEFWNITSQYLSQIPRRNHDAIFLFILQRQRNFSFHTTHDYLCVCFGGKITIIPGNYSTSCSNKQLILLNIQTVFQYYLSFTDLITFLTNYLAIKTVFEKLHFWSNISRISRIIKRGKGSQQLR